MKKTYLAFFLILIILVVPSSRSAISQPSSENSQGGLVEITEFLKEIGDKYDCYFTIEVALESGNIDKSFEKKKIAASMQKRSLRDEMERISRLVPELAYEFNENNPKIIHIADTRLMNRRNYPMQRVIPSINFEGRLFDFVDAIAQQGVSISSRGLVDIHANMSTDFSTLVKVKVKGKSVRNLLTNSIAIENRPRVLWIARTELASNATTYVRYLK